MVLGINENLGLRNNPIADREFDALESLGEEGVVYLLPDTIRRAADKHRDLWDGLVAINNNPHATLFSLPSALFGGSEVENKSFIRDHGSLPRSNVRPAHTQAEYVQSAERSFFKVAECCIWDIERTFERPLQNPYLYATMSECSLLVAHTQGRIIVAHASFGGVKDVEAAYCYMMEKEIRPEDIFAVPSMTPDRIYGRNKEISGPVYETVRQYEDLGILRCNIMPFTPRYEILETEPSRWHGEENVIKRDAWRDLGMAVITPKLIGTYRFDQEVDYHQGLYERGVKISDFYLVSLAYPKN